MDASMSDIVVVLDKAWENDLAGALAKLKACGMEVCAADDEKSVVEGQIETCKVHDLEKLECVEYVRKVFTWDANYPPEDPRDRDGVEPTFRSSVRAKRGRAPAVPLRVCPGDDRSGRHRQLQVFLRRFHAAQVVPVGAAQRAIRARGFFDLGCATH